MLGSLVHGLPVTALHSHYIPAASQLVGALGRKMPDEQTVQALVDMAGVRWVLVDPAVDERRAVAWSKMPGVVRRARFPDGEVFEIRRLPRRPWRRALAAGPRPDRSLLGAPLAPAMATRPEIRGTPSAVVVKAGQLLIVSLVVRNAGAATWPAIVPPGVPAEEGVAIEAVWVGAERSVERIGLPWDVVPGDSVHVLAVIAVPATPGTYALTFGVAWAGSSVADPDSTLSIEVTA
jgi:hypothetical protein